MARTPKTDGAVARYTPLGDLGATLAERLAKHPETVLIGVHEFPVDEPGMVSLTEIWKAAGSPAEKKPADWLSATATRQMVTEAAVALNADIDGIIRARRGRGGGTRGHWHLGLSYAEYLDPQQHVLVHLAYMDRVEEETTPDVALERSLDRACRGYERAGKTAEWVSRRVEGKLRRREFVAELTRRRVGKEGYRTCTNAVYRPLFDASADELRARRGLSASASLRDDMTADELTTVQFAEMLATRQMARDCAYGEFACATATERACRGVRQLVDDAGGLALAAPAQGPALS